jgi:hypothetical protein
MTPQERDLITQLFDRLATLENAPRDPDAERAIIEGLRRAPNAAYALVQTALVQDEALRRADARIRALEAQLGEDGAPQPGGFLDSMRETLLGRREPQRGSVPSVHPQAPSQVSPSQVSPNQAAASQNQEAALAPGTAWRQGPPGGSFLGTAAAAAAGVIGGSLLLDGIRSVMGPHHGTLFADPAHATAPPSPWDNSGGGNLAREAGIDDIGRDPHSGSGLFDAGADDAADQDVADYADNSGDFGSDFGGGDFGGGDSDV